MRIRKKIIIILVLTILAIIMLLLLLARKYNVTEDTKMVIRVGGWDMEYIISDRILTIEDFESIQLGSSIDEIESVLGKPDGWVGSGILSPVYILQDKSAVKLIFEIEDTYENLGIIIHYKDQNMIVIKEREWNP